MPMKPKAGGRVYSAKQYQAVNMPETCVHTPAVHAGQTLFVPAESSMQRADTPEQPTQEDGSSARKTRSCSKTLPVLPRNAGLLCTRISRVRFVGVVPFVLDVFC